MFGYVDDVIFHRFYYWGCIGWYKHIHNLFIITCHLFYIWMWLSIVKLNKSFHYSKTSVLYLWFYCNIRSEPCNLSCSSRLWNCSLYFLLAVAFCFCFNIRLLSTFANSNVNTHSWLIFFLGMFSSVLDTWILYWLRPSNIALQIYS